MYNVIPSKSKGHNAPRNALYDVNAYNQWSKNQNTGSTYQSYPNYGNTYHSYPNYGYSYHQGLQFDNKCQGNICSVEDKSESSGLVKNNCYSCNDDGYCSSGLDNKYHYQYEDTEVNDDYESTIVDKSCYSTNTYGYRFKRVVDGYSFMIVKSQTRTHIVAELNPKYKHFETKFILPEIESHDFSYLQVWVVSKSGHQSAEIGFKNTVGRTDWSTLVFNTDDGYKTGWFGNKFIKWAPMSRKRTDKSGKFTFNSGNLTTLKTKLEKDSISAWINEKFIGMIKIDFPYDRFEFGFEQDHIGPVKEFEVKSMRQWN